MSPWNLPSSNQWRCARIWVCLTHESWNESRTYKISTPLWFSKTYICPRQRGKSHSQPLNYNFKENTSTPFVEYTVVKRFSAFMPLDKLGMDVLSQNSYHSIKSIQKLSWKYFRIGFIGPKQNLHCVKKKKKRTKSNKLQQNKDIMQFSHLLYYVYKDAFSLYWL